MPSPRVRYLGRAGARQGDVIDLSELWRCTVEKRRREELERLEAFGQIVRVPDGGEGEAFSWCLDHGGTFLVDWRHGAG
jgi:hypothetical protein